MFNQITRNVPILQKLIFNFSIQPTSNFDVNKLSIAQRQRFQKLPQTIVSNPLMFEKQNLLIYLFQRCSPSVEPFICELSNYILENKIKSNSDIERVLKFIKQQTKIGITTPEQLNWNKMEAEFFIQPDSEMNLKLLEEINLAINTQQIISSSDTNKCKQTLRKIQQQFPNIASQTIYQCFQSVLKQNQCQEKQQKRSVYEKCIEERLKTFNPRDMKVALNSEQVYQRHMEVTNGKIQLRFPPEPNGYLHLGHVRSIWLNFHSAAQLEGNCYLRYDDTNPETEKLDYINQIADNVKWFGYVPFKVTYASDYFQELYEFAVCLITQGKAYICEQTKEEINEYRRLKQPSPCRDRDPKESLRIFNEMKEGLHIESKYTLRLKIDYQNPNSTLRDPVIYRVRFHNHPRTGNKWKIYPIYDFAHCICDSLENITHSLCTLEFEIRRELYYWILDNLNLYKPLVYEFSRLNISNNLLSKRKIQKLIDAKIVNGWDDPRLLTLSGLKRRGYTQTSLLSFIEMVNLSRHGNENIIQMNTLEYCIRRELDECAPRLMAIIDPIEVELTGLNEELIGKQIEIPLYYKQKDKGMRKMQTDKKIYIERKDFKETDQNDFFGLSPGKEVALRHFCVVKCIDYSINKGYVNKIKCQVISYDPEIRKKCKGQITWISDNDAMKCEIREYNNLFNIENPQEAENLMDIVNSYSLQIYNGLVPKYDLIDYNIERWQFERLGYYYLDKEAGKEQGMLVFNKIVGLVDKNKKKNLNQ